MILVGSLFSICAVSFLSGKRFDKKHPILIIILVILWIVVIAMNVALFLSLVCNASPQYAIDGLRIKFVILISFFTAIINGSYVQGNKKIPTAMVFSQMVCLIFYVASIPTTDTSLSIIIPIFSSLVLIKFFKSLSAMFKPIMA